MLIACRISINQRRVAIIWQCNHIPWPEILHIKSHRLEDLCPITGLCCRESYNYLDQSHPGISIASQPHLIDPPHHHQHSTTVLRCTEYEPSMLITFPGTFLSILIDHQSLCMSTTRNSLYETVLHHFILVNLVGFDSVLMLCV